MSDPDIAPPVASRGIDEPPPFGRRWSRLYWLVAILFTAETAAMWWLTRWAA